MWIPWLMNIENLSGPKAFRATCRMSPRLVKNLVIEAKHPHSSMAVPLEAKTGGISMQELNASPEGAGKIANPYYI